VPLEEWSRLPRSGRYTTFPAADLPGYGYLIAWTSRASGALTTRWATIVQVGVEAAGLLLFLACVAALVDRRAAWLSGLVYVFAYPFIWPVASLPMRDVFLVGYYGAILAAVTVFWRGTGTAALAASAALIAVGSALLWVRPHGYGFNLLLVPLVLFSRRRGLRDRLALASLLVVLPWLVFGRPLQEFNERHYGVADTDAVGRTLWEHMGIVPDNPYGFALDDGAMLPWIEARYGRRVEYASPEMNRILGDYAREVIRHDPVFFLQVLAATLREMARTPLDFVPPFPLIEYGTSGLSLRAYAQARPWAFAFKAANRVLLTVFFYGALVLAARFAVRRRDLGPDLLLLLSPLVFTVAAQALLHAEPRYMATGAWVLVLPFGLALASGGRPRSGRATVAP
jgi:hypothetical protein